MKSCLFLNEIPEKYKDSEKYKVFKRGCTSILIEDINSSDNLLMFTRDWIKTEYFVTILDFKFIDSYFSNTHTNSFVRDFEIAIIEVPRLSKITKKEFNKIIKETDEIIESSLLFNKYNEHIYQDLLNKLLETLDESHVLHNYFRFLSNYDNWTFDIKLDSILKNQDTNIYYPIDLVIPRQFMSVIHNTKKVYY